MNYLKRYTDFINEKNSTRILYHFLNYRKLDNIIEDENDKFKLNFIFKEEDLGFSEKYYMSTTRQFDFDWDLIRITFDATKLSHNYEIIPVHFNNKSAIDIYRWKKKNLKDSDTLKIPLDTRTMMDDEKKRYMNNQFEERVLSDYEVNDLTKYIIRVDIHKDLGEGLFLYIASIFEQLNIPCYSVEKFEPYYRKDKISPFIFSN